MCAQCDQAELAETREQRAIAEEVDAAYARGDKAGAERERRRIRRAQAKALEQLWERRRLDMGNLLELIWNALDSSTRAPRAKRRRGK
jgi:hypothetical protein